MHQFITLVLTTMVAINNLRISQATLYTYSANNVKGDHHIAPLQSSNAASSNYIKLNKENIEQQAYESKLKFHNTQTKIGSNQDTPIKHQAYDDDDHNDDGGGIPSYHHPSSRYTSVDYNIEHGNDVENAYEKQPLYRPGGIRDEDDDEDYAFMQQEKPSLLKLLQSQQQELSEGYAAFLQDGFQLVAPPKQESGSSNDHQQSQYLTAYVTPQPPTTKMHLDLHHHQQHHHQHQQQQQNHKPTIVSYATSNDASPLSTTTSIKSQQHKIPQYGVKYVTNNELNSYDNSYSPEVNRKPALEYGLPGGGAQPGSKQFVFAPMRSHLDTKLSYSPKTFPYPPSFISLTTTEEPTKSYYSSKHRSAYNKIPDFFSHRQSKSLLDSYIPSWQVTKMLQQYQGKQSGQGNHNNNLHTLAFVMPYKNYYKREVTKDKK